MKEKEAFEIGLPEKVYYIVRARADGDVPMAKKAIPNRIYFDLEEAIANRIYCDLEEAKWDKKYKGTKFYIVKAWIIPIEVVK